MSVFTALHSLKSWSPGFQSSRYAWKETPRPSNNKYFNVDVNAPLMCGNSWQNWLIYRNNTERIQVLLIPKDLLRMRQTNSTYSIINQLLFFCYTRSFSSMSVFISTHVLLLLISFLSFPACLAVCWPRWINVCLQLFPFSWENMN